MTTFETSPLLTPRHGFFTRAGGVSDGVYQGLNCGPGSGDDPTKVAENRARVAGALGVDTLLSVYQVHGNDVVTVTEPWIDAPKADAMVTNNPGIALGVLTADCAPILFADAKAGVIGAAHAGWKGALYGVAENTMGAMEALGADRANITAVIGPCISQPNYEVGQEFFETFADEDPDHTRFFTNAPSGKYLFNLPLFLLSQLRELGVKDADLVQCCTYAEEDAYFSFRRTTHRSEPDYGRQISAITL